MGNKIGNEGARRLSEALKVNTTLTMLGVCGDEDRSIAVLGDKRKRGE